MKNEFVIENFQPIYGTGQLRALFGVTLASGLRINGLRLFTKENGARWLTFPAKKVTDGAGKIAWQPHVEIKDPGILRGFRDGVLAAIDLLMKIKEERV